MSSSRRRRNGLSKAGVAAGLAATVLAGGVAVAASETPGLTSSSKIYACYCDTTGALSHLDYPKVKQCPSGEKLISWNASGPQGARGAKGSQGAIGAQGAKGTQGARGAAGPQGAQGGAGPQGARGAQGAAGAQGSAGAQGPTGPQGASGSEGAQGSPGSQGAQGAQGRAGPVAGFITRGQRRLASGSSGVPVSVVESLQPGPGDYAIKATITGYASGLASKATLACWARDRTSNGNGVSIIESQTSTQSTSVYRVANVTVEGFLFPEPSATIQLVCEYRQYASSDGNVLPTSVDVDATMTITRLTTATTTGLPSPSLRNGFHKAVKRRLMAIPHTQTGSAASHAAKGGDANVHQP